MSASAALPAAHQGRVAILLPRFSRYGGVEQFGFRLAGLLAARGHAVDFICARQEIAAPPGVRVLMTGRPPGSRFVKMLWFLVRAERLRRKGKYDLTLSLGKTWQQDLSRVGGGPLKIFWEQSEKALGNGWPRLIKRLRRRISPANLLTLWLEKHQFTAGSDVVAVSHLVRDWLLRAHTALDPERVAVIYNRPDMAAFSPPSDDERNAARAALAAACPALDGASVPDGGLPEAGTRRVFIGTASTNFALKGVEPLIRSLALLPESAVLFIAGGREHGRYDALARKLGLGGRVVFCGRVDDMPAFYKALDIFILPTFYDACSNAVLEALASGCRVITSACNGAAFFLEEAAVLADPGDVPVMARTLESSMRQPAPPPFVWPEGVVSGLEAFADFMEARLAERRAGASPGLCTGREEAAGPGIAAGTGGETA